jgi:hypothetical protein
VVAEMSSFDVCYSWMMDNEDPKRQYKTLPDPPDLYEDDGHGNLVRVGAHSISGINSDSYPAQFARISVIPQVQRAQAVEDFYHLMFWNKWYAQIVSDEVAKRIFDCAVLDGPVTAVYIVQRAANGLCGEQIKDDGRWGPITVEVLNDQNPASLINSLKAQWLEHAKVVVVRNPARAKYLGTAQKPGPWWTRIMK